jgi:hypothetical protein
MKWLVLLLLAPIASAQTLTIASVSPTEGLPGSTITVTGTGYTANTTAWLTCPSGSSTTFSLTSIKVLSWTELTGIVPSLGSETLPETCDLTVEILGHDTMPPVSVTVSTIQ